MRNIRRENANWTRLLRVGWLSPDIDPWAVPQLATVFVVVLFGLVPLAHLSTNISLLGLTGLALAGLFITLIAIHHLVAGAIAGTLVLATAGAKYPLVRSETALATLEIRLADPFVGIVLVLVALWLSVGAIQWPRGLVVVGLGALWVGWAGLSAVFGAGPAPLAAAFFAIEQAHLMIYFVTGIFLLAVIPLRSALLTIAIAGVGHTLVAVAQALGLPSGALSPLGASAPAKAHRYEPAIDVGGVAVETGPQIGGLAGPATAFASISLLSLAVCCYYVGRGTTRQRILAMGVIPVIIGTLFVSTSDTVRIAIPFVIVGVAATLAWPRLARSVRHRIVALRRTVAAAVVLGVGGVVALAWRVDIEILFGVDSFYSRLETYAAAVAIAREHPLFGVGGANFEFVAESYGAPTGIAAHSVFFEFLAATGIVGVALYLCVLGTVGRYTLAALRDPRADHEIVAVICVWLGGFALLAMLNLLWPRPSSFSVFWLVAGMLVAAGTGRDPVRIRPAFSRRVTVEYRA